MRLLHLQFAMLVLLASALWGVTQLQSIGESMIIAQACKAEFRTQQDKIELCVAGLREQP